MQSRTREVTRPLDWETFLARAEPFQDRVDWAAGQIQAAQDQCLHLTSARQHDRPLAVAIPLGDRENSACRIALANGMAGLIAAGSATEADIRATLHAAAGEYRTQNVVSRRADGTVELVYLPATDVMPELTRLCHPIRQHAAVHPLLLACGAFAHFIAVHPFMDANGRTARRLMHQILRHAGLWNEADLPLAYLMYRDRKRHLQCLRSLLTQGDATAFLPYALQWVAAAAELALLARLTPAVQAR